MRPDALHRPRTPRVALVLTLFLFATNSIANNDHPKRTKAIKHSKFASIKLAQAPSVSNPGAPVTPGSAKTSGALYASRSDVLAQANDIANRRDLDPAWVRQMIGQARRLARVEQLVLPPPRGVAKNWHAYRQRFVEPARIRAGVTFWHSHAQALERAEQVYGVPAYMVVGILGVETLYGQHMGNLRVIDALATLAFDFPAAHPRATERQAFFKNELEQFLSLHSRAGTDPREARGSYAGAMGWPQFMPSSWVRYAVDFDGDGRVDLFNSPVDAIGSVAHYFQGHGWQRGVPTHYPVQIDPALAQLPALLAPDILPSFSVASLSAKGVALEGPVLQHRGQLALVELQNGPDAPSYVLGTDNFYVVTRYNWSSYYAMAVIELGRAVARARDVASPFD